MVEPNPPDNPNANLAFQVELTHQISSIATHYFFQSKFGSDTTHPTTLLLPNPPSSRSGPGATYLIQGPQHTVAPPP